MLIVIRFVIVSGDKFVFLLLFSVRVNIVMLIVSNKNLERLKCCVCMV